MHKRVLVVCTGNLCRSPYAASRLRTLCPYLDIASAGLDVAAHGLEGKTADKVAIRIAREYGVDLREHQATQLSDALVENYDVILVMEREQLERFCQYYPDANYKVFLFGLWTGGITIEDPFNRGELAFRLAFQTIDEAAKEWIQKLA